ncbi:MAG: hypothetical protein WBQ17_10250 [Rhizomicrobium sp.]
MTPVILTRRELYDLVWSKPLRDVAVDLGISDVGLAKVCTRHRVPRPEQGYWNKVHADKPARKSVFVEVEDLHLNRVEINGALSQLSEAVRTQIEKTRAQRKAKLTPAASRLDVPPAIDPTAKLHKSIETTVRALRKARSDAIGTVRTSGAGLCHVEVAETSVERVTTFLDSLARFLEARDLSIQATGTGIAIPRGNDLAVFGLKEKTRRQKHEPTAAELETEARREKKRQQYWSGRRDVDYNAIFGQAYPEFDTVQTGALVFEIEGYDCGMRRSWADGKVQTLETLLDSIVIGVDAILTLRRVEREQKEERERQWNELCRRRDLVKRRNERERQRLAYWRKIARAQREIEVLRQWIERNQINDGDGSGDNVNRMMSWIQARLATLEESISVENVDQVLESKKLFPEIDDLVDALGDPPEEPRYSWQM